MKRFPILLASLLLIGAGVRAQESHVQIKYFKDIDRTVVNSDLIYAREFSAALIHAISLCQR